MNFLIKTIILTLGISSFLISDEKLPNDVRWVRESKEYDKITQSIFFNAIKGIEKVLYTSSFREIDYDSLLLSLKDGKNIFNISEISCSQVECVGKFHNKKKLGFLVKIPKLSNSLINKLKKNKILYQFKNNLSKPELDSHPLDSYAIIVDIDETILDNSNYQVMLNETGEKFNQESWSKWVQEERATLVPGAKNFLDIVRSMNIRIIFISNRMDSNLAPTINNLKKLKAFSDEDIFLLRLDKADTKVVRRGEVYSQASRMKDYPKFAVISYLGDAFGDFPKDSSLCIWGENCHVFPNPMYGKW